MSEAESAEASTGLPEADTPAEVLGTIHFVMHALGRELGERYDAVLRTQVGPNWVQALANIRRHYINKYDPYFALSEPLKHPDSPTRQCLPHGGAFYNLLEDTLKVRNAWSHHEVSPVSLATLKTSIQTIHAFATAAEMKLGKLCSDVTKRINAIAAGTYPPTLTGEPAFPEVIHADQGVEELLAQLERAKANEATLRADAAAALALLEEAEAAEAAQVDLRTALDSMDQRLEQALQEKEKLEFIIESLSDKTPAENEEWVDAVPGHQWTQPVPTRRVTVMSLQPDLFDEATRTAVAAEFGPEAHGIIAAWKTHLPANATIFLSPNGQAVTYLNGAPIYLGSLSPSSESAHFPQTGPSGFFIGHTYMLRMNGTIEDKDTYETLADVNPDHAQRVSDRLLTVSPIGGRLRVTTTGHVARHDHGGWAVIAEVTSDEWFPGHLP